MLLPLRAMDRNSIVQNGYVKLPPGKLANAVTWLEIARPAPAGLPTPAGLALRRLGAPDAPLFHTLFREVGRDWLWAGLIARPGADIAARLARADILSFAAEADGAAVGMLDLELTAEGAEVVYFGFVRSWIGKGAGSWLMDQGKRAAAEAGAARLWLHTCSFDHPRALAFYRRQGFRVAAVGYEVLDDPRVLGLLPRDAAPQVPLVEEP
jgi:ribosomal protein S18 acetylase RimI-like enzyme